MADPEQNLEHNTLSDIVHSPDDGGYWISQWNAITERSRASKKIYPTYQKAKKALDSSRTPYEAWR